MRDKNENNNTALRTLHPAPNTSETIFDAELKRLLWAWNSAVLSEFNTLMDELFGN